jgi:hypothetical protein
VDEALDEKLRTGRALPKSLGSGDSGRSDISELISDGLPDLPPFRPSGSGRLGIVTHTSIVLDEELLSAARRLATDRGLGLDAIVREALEELLGSCQPLPKSLGKWDSGRSDISELISDGIPEPPSWR